jgi:histone deacetylase 6
MDQLTLRFATVTAAEAAVEEELQRVRLKNIHLANTLQKLEVTIRAKEELAEGLHLIDFEQLKIENQSLNEKIEERNEELVKLRKKMTATVQVGLHMTRQPSYLPAFACTTAAFLV